MFEGPRHSPEFASADLGKTLPNSLKALLHPPEAEKPAEEIPEQHHFHRAVAFSKARFASHDRLQVGW